jgi:hypothetical protein
MLCWSLSPGTARPRVADGGDGLQIWRVAANILNKQSRTADEGWSSSEVLTTHHRKKKKACYEILYTGPRNWTDFDLIGFICLRIWISGFSRRTLLHGVGWLAEQVPGRRAATAVVQL